MTPSRELRFPVGSAGYWAVTAATLAVLGVGLWFAVTTFARRVEPAAKAAVERANHVEIERGMLMIWSVSEESWEAYEGNRAKLAVVVKGAQFALMFAFLAVLLGFLAGVWWAVWTVMGRPGRGA